MKRTEEDLVALALELHAQHPGPRSARPDKKVKTVAVGVATRTGLFALQISKGHGWIPFKVDGHARNQEKTALQRYLVEQSGISRSSEIQSYQLIETV